ncbi:MAG TPA: lytic murein transglycosylase [Solirubrobacteraceae bacterium]|jgi:murein DD-endopeptidase MepM/ murein hydrolase activator NlpD
MASGSPEHGPDKAPATGDRAPAGRLRLAAGLAGAGVLAIGFGAGIVQSAAQDAAPENPGEGAVGAGEPVVAPAAQTTAESPAVTETQTSTAPAQVSSTGTPPAAEQRAPAATAAPAEHAAPAPDPAPAEQQPAAQAPATAEQAPVQPKPEESSDEAAVAANDAADTPGEDAAEADETCDTDEAADIRAALEGTAAAEAPVKDEDGEECPTEDAKHKPKPRRRHASYKPHPAPDKPKGHVKRVVRAPAQAPIRSENGVPTIANPTTSIVMPGPAAIGVPNFFIDKFRIPPFLLSIYQAAGIEYGVRWEVLAAINEIETDYGRNLNVSSAGALGWMQFMPSTWKQYGVDANGDRKKDPYNPVDAIFAAAKYLKAAGGEHDLRRAIFAYNHADWYVDSVLMRARLVGGLPPDLVGSLTGLTQGRFPLDGKARYADDLSEREAHRKISAGENAAVPVNSDSTRRGILLFAEPGTAAVATHDGKVVARGTDARLGRYVRVRDAYGNTYTYARLAGLEASYPVAKHDAKPQREQVVEPRGRTDATPAVEPRAGASSRAGGKERLFASPRRPHALKAGGAKQVGAPVPVGRDAYVKELLHLDADQVTWKRLKPGASVVAGTVLGHVGRTHSTRAPHMLFEIRPAGRGAPRIDPKPILDGWHLLESTAVYRAKGRNPFFGEDAKAPSIGQILLMSKESLQRRVLADPHVDIYPCGREDVRSGAVDRRVLALLEFLAANGLRPGISSLSCGHGYYTSSGNVSEHTTGTAVDIASVNGIPIVGHQGAGSITDVTIRRILTLQGAMEPHQIISLMTYPGRSNTLAMGDHNDHIHVGYRPVGDDPRTGKAGKFAGAILKPGQWRKVIERLGEIENPVVRTTPSKASIKVTPKRHGNAGRRAARD